VPSTILTAGFRMAGTCFLGNMGDYLIMSANENSQTAEGDIELADAF
jgi:hypothetical protein